jgi:hypothetical protein
MLIKSDSGVVLGFFAHDAKFSRVRDLSRTSVGNLMLDF